MAANEMTETQKVHFVRNTLIAAGQEMGAEGDHWPVIKSTVHSIMKDYENLQVERNVHAEMKTHIGQALAEVEKALDTCPADLKPEMQKMVRDLWDLFEAQFADANESMIIANEDEVPTHIKRAKEIAKVLETDHAE